MRLNNAFQVVFLYHSVLTKFPIISIDFAFQVPRKKLKE